MNSLSSVDSVPSVPDEDVSTSSPSLSPPSPPVNGSTGLAQMVQQLLLQLKKRDETIEQLRSAIESEEKVHSKRINLLERQIEQLVELSSKECARQGKSSLEKKLIDAEQGTKKGTKNREISALQELLSRVIAEKDQLICENKSIKSLLKQRNGEAGPPSSAVLSMINMPSMNTKCKTKFREEKYDFHRSISSDECQEETKKVIHGNEKAGNERGSSPVQKELLTLHYQMSCRKCRKNHSHFNYKGSCTTTTPTKGMDDLTEKLKLHFDQVSKMVREEEGSISSSVRGDEWDKEDFPSSSFARHLAKHCQSLSHDGDVFKWCEKNVKVEIQKDGPGGDDDSANCIPSSSQQQETKKGQKQSGKKSKKKNILGVVHI